MDMKPRTVRFQLQTLRAYLTRLHEAGLLDAVQLANVRRVPCPPQQARGHAGRRLSREEIALVLSDKGQLPVDRFMRAAFFVLVTTGMRISEMLALPADCMGKEGRIELIQKGSRAHTVWITKPVLQVLRLHWQDVPDRDHLVQWPGSKQILRNNFDRELKKLADRVGIEHFTPHDLRRTVATSLLEKGIDPYVLSSILGHSKPETTAIYDRRPDAVKQQAIQDMVETIEEGKIIYSAPLGILSQGKG
jgi:integrase